MKRKQPVTLKCKSFRPRDPQPPPLLGSAQAAASAQVPDSLSLSLSWRNCVKEPNLLRENSPPSPSRGRSSPRIRPSREGEARTGGDDHSPRGPRRPPAPPAEAERRRSRSRHTPLSLRESPGSLRRPRQLRRGREQPHPSRPLVSRSPAANRQDVSPAPQGTLGVRVTGPSAQLHRTPAVPAAPLPHGRGASSRSSLWGTQEAQRWVPGRAPPRSLIGTGPGLPGGGRAGARTAAAGGGAAGTLRWGTISPAPPPSHDCPDRETLGGGWRPVAPRPGPLHPREPSPGTSRVGASATSLHPPPPGPRPGNEHRPGPRRRAGSKWPEVAAGAQRKGSRRPALP